MARAFQQAKEHVLKCFYYYIIKSDSFASLSAESLKPIVEDMSAAHIYLVLKSLDDDGSVESDEDENGIEIFRFTEKGMFEAEKVIIDSGQTLDEFEASFFVNIPEDFPVPVDSENPDVNDAKATLDELVMHLNQANDLGDLSEREKEAASIEVQEIRGALEAKHLRPATFVGRVEETLGWIIRKAGETTVSELAKKALGLILKYFGFY